MKASLPLSFTSISNIFLGVALVAVSSLMPAHAANTPKHPNHAIGGKHHHQLLRGPVRPITVIYQTKPQQKLKHPKQKP